MTCSYDHDTVMVSDFMLAQSKSWDSPKVCRFFEEEDARLILATRIPQSEVEDRVAWIKTSNGQYSVKSGYHQWHESNVSSSNVTPSNGGGKIWRISIPNKVKVFLWHFFRNNVPVRKRLRSKGVSLTILCPMCEKDVEHLLHKFFHCPFA